MNEGYKEHKKYLDEAAQKVELRKIEMRRLLNKLGDVVESNDVLEHIKWLHDYVEIADYYDIHHHKPSIALAFEFMGYYDGAFGGCDPFELKPRELACWLMGQCIYLLTNYLTPFPSLCSYTARCIEQLEAELALENAYGHTRNISNRQASY